jgi:hypothetical protein
MAEGSKWTPYLEKMGEQIDQLKPTELSEWEGHDLSSIQDMKDSQITGGFKAYSAEKIEKIGLGSLALSDGTHYGFCTIIPQENYDLPLFLSRWEEREKEITFLVDIIPTVDSLIDEEYRKKYIESIQKQLWDRFVSLAGICPEESDIIRSLCSIIYTAAKVPIEKEGMRLAALAPHTEYLKNYIAFVPDARPVESATKKQEIQKKKTALRETLRKNFFKEIMQDTARQSLGENNLALMTTLFF